jgi:hypothetical protein
MTKPGCEPLARFLSEGFVFTMLDTSTEVLRTRTSTCRIEPIAPRDDVVGLIVQGLKDKTFKCLNLFMLSSLFILGVGVTMLAVVWAFMPGKKGLSMGQGSWLGRAIFARAMFSWWRSRQVQKENAGRFLDGKELGQLLKPSHTGLLLDGSRLRLSDDDSFRNLAVVATTGAGKTSSFIVPNLLSLDGRSIVATDPSGTLYERCAGDLTRRGYKVLRLSPADLGSSIGYNPLDRAKTFPEMQEIAHILIRTQMHGAKVDPFWVSGAEEITSILIKCLKGHPGADRYANLANLQYLLQSFGDGTALTPFVAASAPDDQTYGVTPIQRTVFTFCPALAEQARLSAV